MLSDSYIVPECFVGPRTFGGLMALYESNYIQLERLIGDIHLPEPHYASSPQDDRALYLSVEGSTRYTRVLRMTYYFDEPEGLIADPDMSVRVYLDARMVEVIGWSQLHRHNVLRNLHSQVARDMNRCWTRNTVLSKWLTFLIDKNHQFAPAALPDDILAV